MVDMPCALGVGLGLEYLTTRRNRSTIPPRKEAIELVNTSPRAGGGAAAGSTARVGGSAVLNANVCSDDDEGEDRLLRDFGPGSSQACYCRRAPGWSGSSFDSPTRRLDRYVTDEHGLRHRIVYEPTELARLLQPAGRPNKSGARWHLMANVLEAALDPIRPRCESLLFCKAITDAYLVSRDVGVTADGGDDEGYLLVQTLRQAWQHAVAFDHWDGYVDYERRHRAVDLHLAASWFQAWEASDDSTGHQRVRGASAKRTGTPTCLLDVLPGDWVWVLDQLQDSSEGCGGASDGHDLKDPEYPVKGLHLEEELELEATKEQNLGLPREKWALGDLKRSLQLVSDDQWFQKGGGMIDLRVLGPNRPSTFKKVFSDVPGAIYGCLKDLAGVALTPPTFRMYTTGDIFDALGADVVERSRDIGGETEGEVELGDIELNVDPSNSADSDNSCTTLTKTRQVVSLVEIQVTWIGGYTHVLGWLDCLEA